MDMDTLRIAGKFVNSVGKMAKATEKIGNLTEKLTVKFDEEMAKHRGKYFAKSGDQFKLATDVTIPAKEKQDIDPDERVEDEVIKAGAIVTVNAIVRHHELVYRLVYKATYGSSYPLITVSSFELREMLEGGILEEV